MDEFLNAHHPKNVKKNETSEKNDFMHDEDMPRYSDRCFGIQSYSQEGPRASQLGYGGMRCGCNS